jgi:FkbM family methyltransferase
VSLLTDIAYSAYRVASDLLGFARRTLLPSPDPFLSDVSGVIHVGANVGQERRLYDRLGLQVIWVEPIPAVFKKLQDNIRRFPRQRAFQTLLTDTDGKVFQLKITNNGGASSSILDLAEHRSLWPFVRQVDKLQLEGVTLSTLIQREHIELGQYQALVLDTQGSELLVLRGAQDLLKHFRYIKTEAPNFEAYRGCCKVDDLTSYLGAYGFREIRRARFAGRAGVGDYFDIVFKRDG